jgi:hypothetical protein
MDAYDVLIWLREESEAARKRHKYCSASDPSLFSHSGYAKVATQLADKLHAKLEAAAAKPDEISCGCAPAEAAIPPHFTDPYGYPGR